MQTWFSARAAKFAFGWGLVVTCVAACGCWNSNPQRSTINNTRPIGLRPGAGTRNPGVNNTATPSNATTNGNTPAVNSAIPSNNRISGLPPDTSNRIGLNTGAMASPNNGTPPHFNNVQPAGGVMPGVNNNTNLTPIATSSGVPSSPKINLPATITASEPPPPDPTPGAAAAPPVVSMQGLDPSFNRPSGPPPIPANEVPPSLSTNPGIKAPPDSPVRSIR